MTPKIIAYSNGLTVIPFENVTAVSEDPSVTGQILVSISGQKSMIYVNPENAKDFIERYNTYLCTVESLTMTMRIVPDDGGDK